MKPLLDEFRASMLALREATERASSLYEALEQSPITADELWVANERIEDTKCLQA